VISDTSVAKPLACEQEIRIAMLAKAEREISHDEMQLCNKLLLPGSSRRIGLDAVRDVKKLDGSSQTLTDEDIIMLVEALGRVGSSAPLPLRSLYLHANCITDVGGAAIASALPLLSNLRVLHLHENELTHKGKAAIKAATIGLENFEELSMGADVENMSRGSFSLRKTQFADKVERNDAVIVDPVTVIARVPNRYVYRCNK